VPAVSGRFLLFSLSFLLSFLACPPILTGQNLAIHRAPQSRYASLALCSANTLSLGLPYLCPPGLTHAIPRCYTPYPRNSKNPTTHRLAESRCFSLFDEDAFLSFSPRFSLPLSPTRHAPRYSRYLPHGLHHTLIPSHGQTTHPKPFIPCTKADDAVRAPTPRHVRHARTHRQTAPLRVARTCPSQASITRTHARMLRQNRATSRHLHLSQPGFHRPHARTLRQTVPRRVACTCPSQASIAHPPARTLRQTTPCRVACTNPPHAHAHAHALLVFCNFPSISIHSGLYTHPFCTCCTLDWDFSRAEIET
jgi:hypothetical protein